MAISGQGTETDPFLVSSYDELKSVFSAGGRHTKLISDIDCNDYGIDFEWQTISFSFSSGWLDLDGHTIKNAMVAKNGVMFQNKYNNGSGSAYTIKNGKILNIFNNSASRYFEGVNFYNVSMSLSGTNLSSNVFYSCTFDSCAVYIKSNKLNGSCLQFGTSKNSDFWFDIKDLNSKPVLMSDEIDNCRIRGKVAGKVCLDMYSFGTYRYTLFTLSNARSGDAPINYSVIELDTTDAIAEGGGRIITGRCSATVYNKDISPKFEIGKDGFYPLTTEQIRNADSLDDVGFLVVDVTP